MAEMSAEGKLSVLQYNLLLEELGSNFVPRTMREPSAEELQRAFAGLPGDTALAERWAALRSELEAEYRKWHPLKEIILDPQGVEARIRALWGEPDLLALSGNGWNLRGLELASSCQLGEKSSSAKTLLGILRDRLGPAAGDELYKAIREVHERCCVWPVRGASIISRIKALGASVVVLEEYDMHELPTAGHPSFKAAMAELGYDGACFRGPGQAAMGVGLFWRLKELALSEGASLPESRVIRSGEDLGFAANLDFEEAGFREMDRRSLALARLVTPSGSPVLLCGAHLMTTSRDKGGEVRAFELTRIREFISSRATAQDAVLLCGDFNIDIRARREEHVLCGIFGGGPCEPRLSETGYKRPEGCEAGAFNWRRSDGGSLVLRDAFGDVNAREESCSTRTASRLETIDYIFHDESRLELLPGTRSELRCPEESMPNETEPSDHLPLVAAFRLQPLPTA